MRERSVGGTTRKLLVAVALAAVVAVCSSAQSTSSATSKSSPVSALRPTQVNVTNDPTLRYGEPEVAVNPKNPDNLVYHVMRTKQTYACEKQGDANCTTFSYGLAQGQFNDPHWIGTKVFVSFDRGRTWKNAKVPPVPKYRGFPGEAKGHSDLTLGGDPMVTATANGTFYIAWDISHETLSPITDSSGGVAVSKSTDGGRTWSTPVLTGTPLDRPWMTTDLSTGTIYLASGSPPGTGSLGSFSTGNNKQPLSTPPGDRWLVSSHDGVHWTAPRRLGGGGVPGFSGASGDTISAGTRCPGRDVRVQRRGGVSTVRRRHGAVHRLPDDHQRRPHLDSSSRAGHHGFSRKRAELGPRGRESAQRGHIQHRQSWIPPRRSTSST